MLKKLILILISTLFIFSCDLEIDPIEEAAPEYVGTWTVDDPNLQGTTRRLVISEKSYDLYLDQVVITGETVTQKQEGGTLTDAGLASFTLTQTERLEGTQMFEVAPSDQITRTVTWSVTGNELTLIDSSTDARSYVSGTYTKQ